MLSRQSIMTLRDLVEIKLSAMAVTDREDMREKMSLQRCLQELRGMAGDNGLDPALLAHFADVPRRGRRRRMAQFA